MPIPRTHSPASWLDGNRGQWTRIWTSPTSMSKLLSGAISRMRKIPWSGKIVCQWVSNWEELIKAVLPGELWCIIRNVLHCPETPTAPSVPPW